MILQTDPALNATLPLMEPNGCAVLLPFWTANRLNGYFVNRNVITHKIELWQGRGWVDEELYINKWAEIHRDLGLSVRYHGHADPELEIGSDQFAYGYWYSVVTGYHHFTSIDNDSKLPTYDPLGVSRTANTGTLQTIRLFTII